MNAKETIKKALGAIEDPSNNQTFEQNNAVRYVSVEEDENKVNLVIGIAKDDDETKKQVKRRIAKVIKIDLGYKGLKIDFELLKKKDSIVDEKRKIKYIGVASGKGGVGKSTVAANLAVALKRIGKQVGIIDADIYGSSIPTLFNMDILAPRADENEKIIPFETHGIELISTEFFIKDDKPVMWRGPMLGKMLNNFFYDVAWKEDIEYIVVDLPPGTGDVALDIQKLIPESEMVIVTTPHPSASHIARRAGYAAKSLNHDILGVVENMAWLNHNGEALKIFGEGGGKEVSDKLETDLLQQIPIGQPEDGHPGIYSMGEDIGVAYIGLANKLVKTIEDK